MEGKGRERDDKREMEAWRVFNTSQASCVHMYKGILNYSPQWGTSYYNYPLVYKEAQVG